MIICSLNWSRTKLARDAVNNEEQEIAKDPFIGRGFVEFEASCDIVKSSLNVNGVVIGEAL